MNILSWDLETAALNADYGIILCAGSKVVGKGKPEVISLLQYTGKTILDKERKLLIDFSETLMEADCWLTWFGTWFDVPFVQSRLLYHGLPTLPPQFPHIDGWKTAKKRLRLRNNRLRTVQEFLGLEQEKDAVLGPIWIKALAGDHQAFNYIVEHCRKDVVVLEQAYERLRPLLVDHPAKSLLDPHAQCPVCGSAKLQKRGFHLTRTRKYQRFCCQQCGSWSKANHAVAKVEYAPQA